MDSASMLKQYQRMKICGLYKYWFWMQCCQSSWWPLDPLLC